MMTVLGSILIPSGQQRALVKGASVDIPFARLAAKVRQKAAIGDLVWVQEDFALLTSKRFGPQNLRFVIPGPVGTVPADKRARDKMHELRWSRLHGSRLERGDSRCTLEIMGITADGLRCLVHEQQVDAFLKEQRAKK